MSPAEGTTMFEVRIHGRRGQGVLVAAELLAIAASLEGRCSQALPGFGAVRAPGEVVAFCRIDEHEISTQAPVTRPDAVIIEDQALLNRPGVLDGLRDDGYLLVNSCERVEDLRLPPFAVLPEWAVTVPASEIARKVTGRPAVNVALLGGFAVLSGAVRLDSVRTAIRQWFRGPAGKANAMAALAAFHFVRAEVEGLARVDVAP